MNSVVHMRRLGLMLTDALLVALALYAGYLLRFNFQIAPDDYRQYLSVVAVFIVVRITLFFMFRLYRGILRYASTSELVAIFASTVLGTILLSSANVLVVPFIDAIEWLPAHEGHVQRVPWPILIIECVMAMLFVGGAHFSRRVVAHALSRRATPQGAVRRVLIVGAGDAGEGVARLLRIASSASYRAVAFVDDSREKQGRRIHGIPVVGPIAQMPAVIEDYDVDDVLIAMPRAKPERLRDIVELCEHAKVGFRILPSMNDVMQGRVAVNQIRPVEIEDLLGREVVQLQLPDERNYLRDQVVMITGAGGSIGSELCRQVLNFNPTKVILLGKGENSIYEIATELADEHRSGRLVTIIGDIRDVKKLQHTVETLRPTIFFHAAAHKHVPLMEQHPDEAVKNNIVGTLNVANAAISVGAKKFLLISSDKAVRPTSVMGATKRVAEMLIFCLARRADVTTQFVAVRFGNVLGSRGSVIPLFKKQIARGGPVTVTHPDVVRYFMTIPEAVSLVIEACSATEQRRLFILDMGEPVRIADLARNLIRLSGFDPDTEIKVEFTGMRPGEKLKEELLTADEDVRRTDMGKIFVADPDSMDCELLDSQVRRLEEASLKCDSESIRAILRDLVPDFSG